MERVPATPAAVQPLPLGSSRDGGGQAISPSSWLWLFPPCCAQAARRLLHDHAYFTPVPQQGACAKPLPTSSPSSPAPSQRFTVWLTCATAAVAGTCGVIVGARLSPWLSRRATRLYTRREAMYRNPLRLLPSPAAVTHSEPRWWRRFWCTSAHRSVSETRQLDYGHAAEWLAACTGHYWLPQRISRPALLKLYSPVCHSGQRSADRDTTEEVQWGTRMINRATRPLAKLSAAAAAAKCTTTTPLAASVFCSIAHLTRAPLHEWQPLPQHSVDVFAACQEAERPCSTTLAAASPLLCLPRHGFALLYDPVARLPVWCGYYLTRERVDRARRQSRCMTFFTDRSLNKRLRRVPTELRARGHDRGHLAPHASVAASPQAAVEASLLSNVLLQHRQINRGVWRWLEAATRAYVRQLPLTDVPCSVANQQRHVANESTTGAACVGTALPSEPQSSKQVAPAPVPLRYGSSCTGHRGRAPRSASPAFTSPVRGGVTCDPAARRTSRRCSRQCSPGGSELIARLLAAPDVGSGTRWHLRLQGGGALGCAMRALRFCSEHWRWRWPCCRGGVFRRHREREVAVNVGPLYYKQRNDVGKDNWQSSDMATVRSPALPAKSSDALSLSRLCCSRSRKANRWRRRGSTASSAALSSSPSPQSLFIPDAFFFSLWNVHTQEHVHLVVPNRPDAASIRAVTAAVAARRPAAGGEETSKSSPSRRRRRQGSSHLSRWPSGDLETALRSLVVSTVELEQLFAESLVELRSRCISASVADATTHGMSHTDRAALSVALRTHLRLFPVYRQRWMWRHCFSGVGSR
ncbi:DNA/RNA non-specific endonuclease-like protein [Leishmania tarentolae]|uniref:DNA/RNA non-specific endonuclease-like protein n=1 Tax=Leishmania tarentolae TaxID=5689 RepID=A0A640KBE0_LEITA|nr:DNA/RNA non-specific endonuclease-like protein [Leishmania tarentolae]